MSARERDRLKVIEAVVRSRMGCKEAAGQLGVTTRQVRRIRCRYLKLGDAGLIHGLRGRRSNRRLSDKMQRRTLKFLKGKYEGFGPTLAAEYLAKQENLTVSRETVRQWLCQAGLWKARRARLKPVHVWRARRSCFGELVQWDTSEHDWLEGRSEGPVYLIGMIDDATSQLYGQFVDSDSTMNNLKVLSGYLQRWGRPVAFYTDKGSVFKTTRHSSQEEQLSDQLPSTQIGRALGDLDIEWIAAHSPQAKGRIERAFGTLQDRLIKGLRLAKASTLQQANRYLHEVFIPMWNERFVVQPESERDAHRSLQPSHRLGQILSIHHTRTVANDYSVRCNNQIWQIDRQDVCRSLRRSRVKLEERMDGSVALCFKGRYLTIHPCQRARRKQETPVALRAPSVSRLQTQKPKKKYVPPPHHPWRTFQFGTKADISTLR